MSGLTVGSLCSGYGGLDIAIEKFFGAKTAWFSEFDKAPSRILAYRWPGVPNLGDMTKIDWASVPRVGILGGGTPCQDLSGAGRRKGMTEGTRSNLWVQMREAVAVIRPSIVIWENVRGAFSAYASSEVESEPGLLGVYGLDRPALRALGRVLGDLSDLGYDTEWVGVRASDAGAPHARFRVFVLAYAQGISGGIGDGDNVRTRRGAHGSGSTARASASTDSCGLRRGQGRFAAPEQAASGRASTVDSGLRGACAVADTDAVGRERHGCRPSAGSSSPTQRLTADTDGERGREGRTGATSVEGAEVPNQRYPRATAADTVRVGFGEHAGESSAEETGAHTSNQLAGDNGVRPNTDWVPYAAAIGRWERVLDRHAPAPTEASAKGAQRLSPRFVEWMMGMPDGWVTDPQIGLTRNAQLKALGNGVVPQQAELALSILWPRVLESLAVAA